MIAKPCARRGCPEVVGKGTSYCPEHAPPPWEGRSGNLMPKGWDRTRSRILRRDRFECQTEVAFSLICGAPANQVDHKTPRSEGGTDDEDNLAAICDDHHKSKSKGESAAGRARAQR